MQVGASNRERNIFISGDVKCLLDCDPHGLEIDAV